MFQLTVIIAQAGCQRCLGWHHRCSGWPPWSCPAWELCIQAASLELSWVSLGTRQVLGVMFFRHLTCGSRLQCHCLKPCQCRGHPIILCLAGVGCIACQAASWAQGAACQHSQTGTHSPLSCGFLTLLLRPCSPRLLRNPALVAGMLCAFCPISLPPFLPTHIHLISVLLQDPFSGCVSISPLNGETSLVLNPQASLENGCSCLQSIKMEARLCLKNNICPALEKGISICFCLFHSLSSNLT